MASYPGFAQEMLEQYLADKTVRAALVDSSIGYNPANDYLSDVIHAVVADVPMTNVTIARADGEVAVTADDVTFDLDPNQQWAVGGVVMYVDSGDPTTSRLIASDLEGAFWVTGFPLVYIVDQVSGFLAIGVDGT